MFRRYTHSGMNNGTYGDLEAGCEFNISGMGNVTINGTIGKSATINKSGMGNLILNGRVEEDVKFNISGMGNTKFAIRPPESVISKIKNAGMGDIKMPGGYSKEVPTSSNNSSTNYSSGSTVVGFSLSISGEGAIMGIKCGTFNGMHIEADNGLVNVTKDGVTTTYAGEDASLINNVLHIDNKKVIPGDSRILHVEKKLGQSSSSSSYSYLQTALAPTRSFEVIQPRMAIQPASRVIISPSVGFGLPDPRTVATTAVSTSSSTTVIPAMNQQQTSTSNIGQNNNLLNAYSKPMQDYLNTFKANQKSYAKIVEELDVNSEEESMLEEFNDPISYDVMSRPVTFNGNNFDLDTLLALPVDKLGQRKCQLTNYEFTLRDLQPARKINEDIQKTLKAIQEKRSNNTPRMSF